MANRQIELTEGEYARAMQTTKEMFIVCGVATNFTLSDVELVELLHEQIGKSGEIVGQNRDTVEFNARVVAVVGAFRRALQPLLPELRALRNQTPPPGPVITADDIPRKGNR